MYFFEEAMVRLFRKKNFFKEYGLDLAYEFETYKHVGRDYGDRKMANRGWIFNILRWRRKRRNQKRKQYKQCDRYSEWKNHVEGTLAVGKNDYDNMLHFLYEKKNAAERGVEGVKCILIPLYIAIIALLSTLSEINIFGTDEKLLFFTTLVATIIGITAHALQSAAKEIAFYKDFIEIAEEKAKRFK